MNDFLTFTKGERIAIITLAAVMLIIIAANFFIAKHPSDVKENLHDLDSIIALHEKAIEESRHIHIAEQHKHKEYHEKSKDKENENRDLKPQKPEFKKEIKTVEEKSVKQEIRVIDINIADSLEWLSLPEIGKFFAKNILEYRDKLGGYIEASQLLEVYGFDSIRFAIISPYISLDSVMIRKININKDDFKTILRHPYIEYEDVKRIVNHRETKGMIKDWETYLKAVGRNDVDDRLKWYLSF